MSNTCFVSCIMQPAHGSKPAPRQRQRAGPCKKGMLLHEIQVLDIAAAPALYYEQTNYSKEVSAMKKNIGNALALYPTPLVVVGAMVNGKPNWLLVGQIGRAHV